MDRQARYQQLKKVSWVTLVVNVLLAAVKMTVGLVVGSLAVVSDAVHTLSDVLTTLLVLVGIRLARNAPDGEHHYGHHKMESMVTIFLGLALAVTAVFIGYGGLVRLWQKQEATPSTLAICVAVMSILVPEAMFQYAWRNGRRLQSSALIADAWHHRSDAISSVAVLLGVVAVDELRSRISGDVLFLEIEIQVDGGITVCQGHAIAEAVHDRLESGTWRIEHCAVHVNPVHEHRKHY